MSEIHQPCYFPACDLLAESGVEVQVPDDDVEWVPGRFSTLMGWPPGRSTVYSCARHLELTRPYWAAPGRLSAAEVLEAFGVTKAQLDRLGHGTGSYNAAHRAAAAERKEFLANLRAADFLFDHDPTGGTRDRCIIEDCAQPGAVEISFSLPAQWDENTVLAESARHHTGRICSTHAEGLALLPIVQEFSGDDLGRRTIEEAALVSWRIQP